MTVDAEMRRVITNIADSEEIQQHAIRNGMIEFRRGALMKVAQGVTSTEEVLRVIPADLLSQASKTSTI